MNFWPTVRLEGVLRLRKEFIMIDDLTVYKRPRVQLHSKGIVLRDEVEGSLIKTKTQQVCRAGELLVAEIDAKVGGFGIVPELIDGAIVSSHYFLFAIDDSKLHKRFLDYLIRTPAFRDQVEAQGSTNYAAIRPTDVLGYEIPLPPLAEQQRIVARVEEFAAKVNEVQRLREQSVDKTDELYSVAVEAAFQALNAEFGTQKLGQVCHSVTDGDHNTPKFVDQGVRFIFVGNVSSGHLHFEDSKLVSEDYFKSLKSPRLPRRGDILYTAVGATLGVPAIVDTEDPFCFQRHVAILKPDVSRLDSQYACYMLRSQTVFQKAWASTTGSAQPTVPLRAIRDLSLPVPPLAEQRRVVAELDALREQVESVKRLQVETAAELDALLPSILDKAFKGEL